MKMLTVSLLALALAAGSSSALAQSAATAVPYGQDFDAAQAGDDRYDNGRFDDGSFDDGHYDYARVLRVVPLGGPAEGRQVYRGQACVSRDEATGYYGGGYRDDGYGAPPVRSGTQGGRAMASVLGSVIGAVIGSQVGGGSARYATTAIGSTVGAVAGSQVYENAQRERAGRVTVCDPVPTRGDWRGADAGPYEVTYTYAGRTYITRTNYDPGNRIRVRVEVHPE